MTKLKPVWRMNKGLGVPVDTKIHPVILFRDDKVTHSVSVAAKWSWILRGKFDDIVAYQTNRAKAAKFERVTCDSCNGHGGIIHEYRGPTREHQFTETCNKCNGTGRMARRITC